MAQLTPRRMTDEVATILRDRIVGGDLPAGGRVDVATLAAELGISRTPVREAILQLEAAGLVVRQPYRGTVVAGVDAGRLEEVTALRVELEGRATLLGVPRLTDADVTRMAAVLAELEARHDDPGFSRGVFNDLNRAFHGIVYAAADSPVLVRLIEVLGAEADRIRLHFDVRSPLAEAYHREILEACRARDASAAARATQLHLVESYLGMRGDGRSVPPGILAVVLREQGIEVPR
jgi:DNA-binding GntR family transcriptional regulator